jgi:chorismate-pyruvate lyase
VRAPVHSRKLKDTQMRAEDLTFQLAEILLTTFSATAALQVWCELRGLGQGDLFSDLKPVEAAPLPTIGIDSLSPDEFEPVRYRAITLTRGDLPLLDADNWYLPGRLPQRAQDLLETTDTPFGLALAGTLQNRRTFSLVVPPKVRALFGKRDHLRGTRIEVADVPVLTLRGVVTIGATPVSYVEEHIRPELIRASVNPS